MCVAATQEGRWERLGYCQLMCDGCIGKFGILPWNVVITVTVMFRNHHGCFLQPPGCVMMSGDDVIVDSPE